MFQYLFGLIERTWNDVNADKFPDATGCRGTRFGRGFHRTDIAADQHRYIPIEKIFLTYKNNVGRLDHCIGRLDCSDETARFYHSQCFIHRRPMKPGAYGSKNPSQKQLTR
jgi:hypothetical protein